ncbi:hypothetical protein TNCT_65941 [Trichonephila clavata]|uniref:Reverse transcriptase domain-containing protein n=1 Tax=Trichonephila clavata TaxID=2740835 RepID=A0A8X6FY31_TRICU|nr:hypothetical protein TNCT_65941 [Trichonephila clavata]
MFLPDGKLEQPSLDPPNDGASLINRLYLSDRTSRSKYLIETGADVLVIPPIAASKHLPFAFLQIFAANGTVISTNGLRQKKRISLTLDLALAYHHIPVQDEDIPKTAVTRPFGLFEFLYMPFGLSNSAATFQRFIYHLLGGMDFCVPYSDDVLVTSEDEGQHLSHLKQVLQRFEQYGMVLIASKSVLGETSVKFLGHVVTEEGISPYHRRSRQLQTFSNQRLRRSFVVSWQSAIFIRRFIAHAAKTQVVLNSYLKGAKKNDWTHILWSDESATAFEKFKKDLAESIVLYHPSANALLTFVVDASDKAVGALLHQQTSKGWQSIVFFSKTLSPAQPRYSAYDREPLAVYMAIKCFRHMVEGRSFPRLQFSGVCN